jgi:4-amino-4-deoxy-L-arabinose transferase-like glycosyltransferase
MIAYGIICYIQTEKNYWLYFTGISAGLGMMSKYSVLFFIASAIAGLLLTPQRKIFTNSHFYLAAIIGFIIFLPNVVWQYNRNFAVFHHMQELQRTQLQYVNPVNFIIDQFVNFLPCVFVWLAGLWFAAFSPNGKKYRFIAWAYVFVIGALLYLHGKGYYALGIYPTLIAFGAYQLEIATAKRLKLLRYAIAAIPFAFTTIIIPIVLPVFKPEKLAAYYVKTHAAKTGALRWEDQEDHPLPQDFADMLGWKEMAQKVSAAYNMLNPTEKQHTIIFCFLCKKIRHTAALQH